MEEIKNMKAIPHPLMVKIIDDYIDSAGHLCIVNDLYSDGSLRDYVMKRKENRFSESEILHFLANIFLVIFHLNSRDIFHRDLKPGKFLMKREANGDTYLHLSDLGGAAHLPIEDYWCAHQTPHIDFIKYLAPEIP